MDFSLIDTNMYNVVRLLTKFWKIRERYLFKNHTVKPRYAVEYVAFTHISGKTTRYFVVLQEKRTISMRIHTHGAGLH